MLGLVRHARACPRFSKITKQQYFWEGLSYFVYLLNVVTRPWKLQCYHAVLVGYGPVKVSCDFADFLQVVICILLDIHCSYKNVLYWAGIVRHSLSANHIVRCFKLKKLKKNMRYQAEFLLPLKLEILKKYTILCYDPEKISASQFTGCFTLGLFSLLNLIPGGHCYILLVYSCLFSALSMRCMIEEIFCCIW